MKFFSIIIPVFNRPSEVQELLESLTLQTFKNFEVVVVEDGSQISSEQVVKSFSDKLNIKYYYKSNSGPGKSRNYGMEKATGDFFVFFDSDCLIPPKYLESVSIYLEETKAEFYGGPDTAHPDFTPVQKAISYSMTAFLTTGGIRGGGKKVTRFHARSFNMGFSRQVAETTKGFSSMRFGEDIDFSLRVEDLGIKCHLIQSAFVYHKRRTDFKKFYKQISNSGIARINLFLKYPKSLKITHFAPVFFLLFMVLSVLMALIGDFLLLGVLMFYLFLIVIDSSIKNRDLHVGMLSIMATVVQMVAYGVGFLFATWKRIILGQDEFEFFKKNFYK